jgi:predicted N-acyltransferase
MLEARIHRSIHDIGREAWLACAPGSLEGFDYLAAVEDANLAGFGWRYAIVEQGGRPVMVAPGFHTDYSLDTTLNPLARQAVAAMRRVAPRAFRLKLAAIGSPCTEDAGVSFHPDASHEQRPAILRAGLEAFLADARREGCGLYAIKDAPQPDEQLWNETAGTFGFARATGLPTAVLEIDFTSIEGYLARLSAATRKDMRRKLKAMDELDIETRTEIGDVADRVMELYGMTRMRADMQFENLTRTYFTGVMDRMPHRALCVLYRERGSGDIIAANLLVHDDQTLLDKFFCSEDARGRANNLYFVSWIQNVRLCLELGLRRYQSGQAGYANKLRLGSRLIGSSMYFRHRNPIVNSTLRLAAPLLSEEQPAAA